MIMRHIPVLLNEVITALNLANGKNVIDCTLGDAGHSEEILKLTGPKGKLLGIDADPEAILRAKKYLYEFGDRVIFERNNFESLKSIVTEQKFGLVDGILIDLGWSSPQFEERGRGFSFLNSEEPLDMRYGVSQVRNELNELKTNVSACEVVNFSSEEELENTFRNYGEEKLSKEIAEAIFVNRKQKQIETVGDLVQIILEVYRKKLKSKKEIPWVGGLHPATKVFQALRIAVNDELGVIERVLPQAIDILKPNGRLAIISFHSLEDRIIKHYFKKHIDQVHIITKKPIVCSQKEYEENPRARSAKLRVVEKISAFATDK